MGWLESQGRLIEVRLGIETLPQIWGIQPVLQAPGIFRKALLQGPQYLGILYDGPIFGI